MLHMWVSGYRYVAVGIISDHLVRVPDFASEVTLSSFVVCR